ncbi:MAG TPA: EcsC family protein [Candidatus Acidoferrales bacterium]|nr:EcsC family protein [Candidatus Acidoferrales bacterium]
MNVKRKVRLSSLIRPSVSEGLRRAYRQVRVDPQKYLLHVQRAHQLPIRTWREVFLLGPEVMTPIAQSTVRASTRAAALEGAGFGIGGFATLLPDMGVLSAITIRMLQKLSLLYGFEYSSDEETADLWMAAASAAGLDLGRDFLEKQAVEKLVPKIVDAMAAKVSAEIAEKWAGRIIPVVSAGAGAALNYYFVRGWGRRALRHFEARHIAERDRRTLTNDLTGGGLTPLPVN